MCRISSATPHASHGACWQAQALDAWPPGAATPAAFLRGFVLSDGPASGGNLLPNLRHFGYGLQSCDAQLIVLSDFRVPQNRLIVNHRIVCKSHRRVIEKEMC